MMGQRNQTTTPAPIAGTSDKIPIHIGSRPDILPLYPRKAEKVFPPANELNTVVFLKCPPYAILQHEMVLIDYCVKVARTVESNIKVIIGVRASYNLSLQHTLYANNEMMELRRFRC
jgi:hypothetical protein